MKREDYIKKINELFKQGIYSADIVFEKLIDKLYQKQNSCLFFLKKTSPYQDLINDWMQILKSKDYLYEEKMQQIFSLLNQPENRLEKEDELCHLLSAFISYYPEYLTIITKPNVKNNLSPDFSWLEKEFKADLEIIKKFLFVTNLKFLCDALPVVDPVMRNDIFNHLLAVCKSTDEYVNQTDYVSFVKKLFNFFDILTRENQDQLIDWMIELLLSSKRHYFLVEIGVILNKLSSQQQLEFGERIISIISQTIRKNKTLVDQFFVVDLAGILAHLDLNRSTKLTQAFRENVFSDIIEMTKIAFMPFGKVLLALLGIHPTSAQIRDIFFKNKDDSINYAEEYYSLATHMTPEDMQKVIDGLIADNKMHLLPKANLDNDDQDNKADIQINNDGKAEAYISSNSYYYYNHIQVNLNILSAIFPLTSIKNKEKIRNEVDRLLKQDKNLIAKFKIQNVIPITEVLKGLPDDKKENFEKQALNIEYDSNHEFATVLKHMSKKSKNIWIENMLEILEALAINDEKHSVYLTKDKEKSLGYYIAEILHEFTPEQKQRLLSLLKKRNFFELQENIWILTELAGGMDSYEKLLSYVEKMQVNYPGMRIEIPYVINCILMQSPHLDSNQSENKKFIKVLIDKIITNQYIPNELLLNLYKDANPIQKKIMAMKISTKISNELSNDIGKNLNFYQQITLIRDLKEAHCIPRNYRNKINAQMIAAYDQKNFEMKRHYPWKVIGLDLKPIPVPLTDEKPSRMLMLPLYIRTLSQKAICDELKHAAPQTFTPGIAHMVYSHL